MKEEKKGPKSHLEVKDEKMKILEPKIKEMNKLDATAPYSSAIPKDAKGNILEDKKSKDDTEAPPKKEEAKDSKKDDAKVDSKKDESKEDSKKD